MGSKWKWIGAKIFIFAYINILSKKLAYGDIHRGTLQLMMNHGTVDAEEFVKIFDKIIEKCKIVKYFKIFLKFS